MGHISTLATIAERMKRGNKRAILVQPAGQPIPSHLNVFDEVMPFPDIRETIDVAGTKLDQIISYNATVKSFGYCQPKYLFTRYSLWLQLLRKIRPDLLVGEYAPSALTVARQLGIPTIATGNGYTLPPANIETYPKFTDQDETVADAEILESVNLALKLTGLDSLTHLPEIFFANVSACLTAPEMDPFDRVRNPRAFGPVFRRKPPSFLENRGNKIFVYLTRCRAETLKLVLDALRNLQVNVDVWLFEAGNVSLKCHSGNNIRFLDAPLSLREICQNYRLCMHLGSHNLAMELIYAGVPQVLLPLDMEKLLYAKGMENAGYAHQLRVDHPRSVEELTEVIKQALADDALIERLQKFSMARIAGFHTQGIDRLIAETERLNLQ